MDYLVNIKPKMFPTQIVCRIKQIFRRNKPPFPKSFRYKIFARRTIFKAFTRTEIM